MVTKWGLSDKLGPLMYDEAQEEIFLGKSAGGSGSTVSGATRNEIDAEVRSIIDKCYATAQKLLEDNRSILDAMADALMKYETIDAAQIDDLMDGKSPRPPKGWSGNGSGSNSSNGSSGQSDAVETLASKEDDSDENESSDKPIS